MTSIPTPLRIAIGFIIALWIVGLTALACDAPGEIMVATAALGTVGALYEWSSQRADRFDDAAQNAGIDTAAAATELQSEAAPHPSRYREH